MTNGEAVARALVSLYDGDVPREAVVVLGVVLARVFGIEADDEWIDPDERTTADDRAAADGVVSTGTGSRHSGPESESSARHRNSVQSKRVRT